MKPEYLSNMVVNRWKQSHECEKKYQLLIMSPSGIERIDRDPTKMQFEGKLEPGDVKLSDAMATSAAAVSTRMGKYDYSIEGLARLHTIIGLQMGATMISDSKSVNNGSLALNVSLFAVNDFHSLINARSFRVNEYGKTLSHRHHHHHLLPSSSTLLPYHLLHHRHRHHQHHQHCFQFLYELKTS